MNPLEIGVLAATLALLPAWIAQRKGRSFTRFYVFGFLLFIVALPVALLIKDTRPPAESSEQLPDLDEGSAPS